MRLRSDGGAVLVFVLLLLLALVGLGHGLLVTALAELAASSAGVRHLAARAAADGAVARVLRTAGGPWMDSIGVGEARVSPALALGRSSGSGTLTRLTRESWLVEGRGSGPGLGASRAARLAWALDPLERIGALPAAIGGRADALWEIEGVIDADDAAGVEPPLAVDDCAPWLDELASRWAGFPLPAIGVVTDTAGGPSLGLLDFAALFAAAEVRVAGSGTPEPVERWGSCVVDEPWGWGDPERPERACGSQLPLRAADGDLLVEGGAGQGMLIVDGDLTLTGGARYFGLLLVRGRLVLREGATLDGMALAWDGAHVGTGSRLRASACWAARALAAQRARLGGLVAVPRVGPIGPW